MQEKKLAVKNPKEENMVPEVEFLLNINIIFRISNLSI